MPANVGGCVMGKLGVVCWMLVGRRGVSVLVALNGCVCCMQIISCIVAQKSFEKKGCCLRILLRTRLRVGGRICVHALRKEPFGRIEMHACAFMRTLGHELDICQ